MQWSDAVELVKPHVVQISTPGGTGTGFFLWRSLSGNFCAVATAAHVTQHAYSWEQPVRFALPSTGNSVLLRAAERAILTDPARDTAVILFNGEEVDLPPAPLALIDHEHFLRVGVEIGWIGYPAIPGAELCFFAGGISAWLEKHDAYFVDGVAINGVSGGPAFAVDGPTPYVIGVVSAYVPNRATGETLPGLSIVRDVTQFHEFVQTFNSLEEAKAKEKATSEPETPLPG